MHQVGARFGGCQRCARSVIKAFVPHKRLGYCEALAYGRFSVISTQPVFDY